MMEHEQVQETLNPLIDLLPEGMRAYWWLILGVAALVVLLLLWAVIDRVGRALFGQRSVPADLERSLQENLAEYPPPAKPPGPRRLTFEGMPVRLRLVVMAPTGNQAALDAAAAEALLDQVIRGLKGIVEQDQPRMRIWPAQLSNQGFAPTFHRVTRKPEPDGQPSRWILLAGQARAGQQPVLLGLALWADEANTIGRLTLGPNQWGEMLRVRSRKD